VRYHYPPQQWRKADGASLYGILMWLKYGLILLVTQLRAVKTLDKQCPLDWSAPHCDEWYGWVNQVRDGRLALIVATFVWYLLVYGQGYDAGSADWWRVQWLKPVLHRCQKCGSG